MEKVKFSNRHNLPQPLVNLAYRDKYFAGKSNRSVTQLIDSPRRILLRQDHRDEIVEDVSERLWAMMGSALHEVLEQGADEQHIAETRLYHEVNDWVISGAIDVTRILKNGVGLQDYKFTSVWAVMNDKPEWAAQLNMYAWLARHAKGYDVTELEVVAMLRDWNRKEAMRRPDDYPQAQIMVVPIPIWSDQEQDEYAMSRIQAHKDAETDRMLGHQLILCTDEERWMKPTTYAVMKNDNKRATRVFDDLEEASEFMKGQCEDRPKDKFRIETRIGEPTRCVDFCAVAQWCDQHTSWRDANAELERT